MMHTCVGKTTTIGSDNGLSPGRRQAIIWTNAGILLIVPSGTNFNEIFIAIQTFSFKKIHSKMSSGKWRPFCLGLNVLRILRTSSGGDVHHDSLTLPVFSQWGFPKLLLLQVELVIILLMAMTFLPCENTYTFISYCMLIMHTSYIRKNSYWIIISNWT